MLEVFNYRIFKWSSIKILFVSQKVLKLGTKKDLHFHVVFSA
jgi:hypothetical protein